MSKIATSKPELTNKPHKGTNMSGLTKKIDRIRYFSFFSLDDE